MARANQRPSERRPDFVDLTEHSDDDENPVSLDSKYSLPWLKAPVPGTTSVAPAPPAPKPQSWAVYVPPSTRSQHHSTINTGPAFSPPQEGIHASNSHGSPLGAKKTTRTQPHRATATTNYGLAPTTSHDDTVEMESSARAEKRRRTASHQEPTSHTWSTSIPQTGEGSAQSNNARSSSDPASSASAQWQAKMSASFSKRGHSAFGNRPPSVQYMNEVLKRNGPTPSVLNDTTDHVPRPLYINHTPIHDHVGSSEQHVPHSVHPNTLATPTGHTPADTEALKAERKAPSNVQSQGVQPQTSSTDVITENKQKAILERFSALDGHDRDSVMSDVSQPRWNQESSSEPQPSPRQIPNAQSTPSSGRRKVVDPWTEEEEHLLIFLKEVKMFKWSEITKEFNKDFSKPYYTLQSRYSTKINKRDRLLDPKVLTLPKRWAAEAGIDCPSELGLSPGPTERVLYEGITLPNTFQRPQVSRQDTVDYSSGNDSSSRQPRPRRAPPVNYDIRRHRRQFASNADHDEALGGSPAQASALEASTRSITPEEPDFVPERAIAVENEPLLVDWAVQNAQLTVNLSKDNADGEEIPYLSSDQRIALQSAQNDWYWDQVRSRSYQGAILHVDFSSTELKTVEETICQVVRISRRVRCATTRQRLRALLKNLPDSKVLQIKHKLCKRLTSRSGESIRAFLQDAMSGKVSRASKVQRLAPARMSRSMSSVSKDSIASMIRQREIGSVSKRGWKTSSQAVTYQIKNKVMDTLGPMTSWTGASSDIHTVAWSPCGNAFAAGAVAVTDPDSMQYNRPNNLLFGNVMDNTLHELAEHYVQRQKTEAGANSTQEMFVSQDPKLYTTVTAVAFSPTGKVMYSSGYDNSVCIWNVEGSSQPTLDVKMKQGAKVEMMVVSETVAGVFATAAQKTDGSAVKVVRIDEDDPTRFSKQNFHSEKALQRAELKILPQALRFEPMEGRYLLAGFGANVRVDGPFDSTGDICLWDIETTQAIPIHGQYRNVFDVAFNPNRRYLPLFAAGCVASGNKTSRKIRSGIRLYDESMNDKLSCPLEIDCRALDMNDVVWCPHDEYLIAAGCTDGRVYVYDMRQPDDPLRTLSHGRSIMPLQDGIPHECTDTGVRFLSWGDNATRLYSGSSDGVVKVWDVTRSPEDTFIKDVVTVDSGIMAGGFSPDYTKLIVGEVNGSLSVLDVGRSNYSARDVDILHYVAYDHLSDDDEETNEEQANEVETQKPSEAQLLLQSKQMQLAPLGSFPFRQAVQGPVYEGPYDQSVEAPFLRQQALEFQLGMAAAAGPQCDMTACNINAVTFINNEITDSKRSGDRIPDTLRTEWKAIDRAGIVLGKTKCAYCGRSARPSSDENGNDACALCERCSFRCFRCGASNTIAPAITILICNSCAGGWEIGALGYECVDQPTSPGAALDVPPLRRSGRDMLEQRCDDDMSFGDEMNALTDYYFSLAIDRPESPPL